jgi:hypothetical protein
MTMAGRVKQRSKTAPFSGMQHAGMPTKGTTNKVGKPGDDMPYGMKKGTQGKAGVKITLRTRGRAGG